MCGITGFWTSGSAPRDLGEVAREMASAIRHRGPDSAGTWADPEAGVGFGHRRLAILDLSPHGHQPMVSPSGRYVVVFNGEIFNFRELRAELLSRYHFHGDSDTEVLLAAVEAWGLQGAVDRFVGMFAFALWDRESRVLHLVRDRLGIKPLYFGRVGGTFVFASELKAIRAYPGFRGEIDRDALALLLRHNCIPAPHTIYRGVDKLLPGRILTLSSPGAEPHLTQYWSAREVAERGQRQPFAGGDEEAIERLDALLRESVRLRLVSDVPIGAFLSGGIDSSTVVALMQAQSDRPVKTFSIGTDDDEYNEAQHARAVARHLGTDHTELYVTPRDALAVIPRLPEIYDEPFADSSQIPTVLVSELARRHVTVSLSGDGGDELFAGYNRHAWGRRVWRMTNELPPLLRRMGTSIVRGVSPRGWDALFRAAGPLLPSALRHRMPGYKLQKLVGLLDETSPEGLYRRMASHWPDPAAVVLGATEPPTALTDPAQRVEFREFAAQMMYYDLVTYLPDDILTKVDRASMSTSLEARVPLLDHRVVEFAWHLPLSLKLRSGQSKWILRQVLYRYVPKALVERPKSGFGIPLDEWLRGPLREWAEELLDDRRLAREGFLDAAAIRRQWRAHLSGQQDLQYEIWDVLMFQAWLETQGRSEVQPAAWRSDERPVPSSPAA